MNILVTGGAGYIGSVLVPYLLERHQVTVLDRLTLGGEGLLGVYGTPNFKLIAGDIRDVDIVRHSLMGIDTVIHLAAEGLTHCTKYPDEAKSVNLLGTQQLGVLAKEAGVSRFLFASSCSCYGKTGAGELASEEGSVNPLTAYAETKLEAEQRLLTMSDDRFWVTLLRFATVFGISPQMRFDVIVNEFAFDAVMKNELLVYRGDVWRSHIHVRDLAQAIVLLLGMSSNQLQWQVINVGGYNRKKRELADALANALPSLVVYYVEELRGMRDYRVDFSRAAALGIDVPRTPEYGLQEVVNALRVGIFRNPHSSAYRRE